MDMEKLDKDMKDPQIEAKIERDKREGKRAGVRGIPAVFVNGRQLKNRSFQGFQAAIEKELARGR